MSEKEYYDGTKLLSLKDLNGNTPEVYMCTGNRTGGKTTYFNRLLLNRFKKRQQKFALIYRYNYELDDVDKKFFKDIHTLFFPNDEITSKSRAKGIYHELFLNDESCGYALTLNSADQIKKMSHLFSDVENMFMDEYQSETNHYCNDEVKKLISVHTSLARGQGKQVKYLPLFMASNSVSLINPYYSVLEIGNRLRNDTNFLRGNGFVLEQCFIESASIAQQESGFNKAFSKDSYVEYSSQNVYLNDNYAFIETPKGKNKYLATLIYKGQKYSLREYRDIGIIYCGKNYDDSFPFKLSITTADHNVNYVMLKSNEFFISNMRYYFEKGCFRFKDLQCKEAILTALSY